MIRVTTTAGGTGYADFRVGDVQQHQALLAAAGLAASRDSDGNLPPGLPVNAAGSPVTAGDAYAIVGPEAVALGDVDVFGNAIFAGVLNRDMIEDNLGRALTAAELTGIASGMPQIRLI